MAATADLLRRIPLLACLDDPALSALMERGQEKTFTAGSPVTSTGSRGSGFFVILEGEATVRVKGAVTGQLRRGDHFGELALIDGGRRSADITADDHLLCFGLSQRAFRVFVEEHPDVAWALLERLVGLLRASESRTATPAPARRGLRRARH